jgi:hypothetical protein
VPSSAVPTTVIVFDPTVNAIAEDAEPEVTADPFTVMVVFELFRVGVTVIDVVAFETVAVYEVVPEANVGESVPVEVVRALNVASVEIELTSLNLILITD